MKNFLKSMESLGLLCVLGACGLAFLNLLVVIAACFGFFRPFRALQFLRVPYWSVALPALGILALLPLALRQAFMHKTAPEEEREAELDWRQTFNSWRS